MFSVENVGIALPGIAFDTFSPDAARAFFESQPPMYFAMSALFFSSIIMCPLPDMPAFSELDVLGLHAGLLQPLHRAVIVDIGDSCLPPSARARECSGGSSASAPAPSARNSPTRPGWRLVVELDLQLRRCGDRRLVRDRGVRDAPARPPTRRRSRYVTFAVSTPLSGGPPGSTRDDRLHQVRTRVRRSPSRTRRPASASAE